MGTRSLRELVRRAAGGLFQPLEENRVALRPLCFEFVKRELRVQSLAALQPEDGPACANAAVVEQPFVDVPDLFDVEAAIAHAPGLGDAAFAEGQDLERVEHGEHRPIVDRQWMRLGLTPGRARRPPFEE